MNESRHIWMSHVTYEIGKSHIIEIHVTFKWVQSSGAEDRAKSVAGVAGVAGVLGVAGVVKVAGVEYEETHSTSAGVQQQSCNRAAISKLQQQLDEAHTTSAALQLTVAVLNVQVLSSVLQCVAVC